LTQGAYTAEKICQSEVEVVEDEIEVWGRGINVEMDH
jgi:hypothetical protein